MTEQALREIRERWTILQKLIEGHQVNPSVYTLEAHKDRATLLSIIDSLLAGPTDEEVEAALRAFFTPGHANDGRTAKSDMRAALLAARVTQGGSARPQGEGG